MTGDPLSPAPTRSRKDEVSLLRLYVLRFTYLLLVVGLGLTEMPDLVSHGAAVRGVIPSLLAGVWLLAILGLRHPLKLLPLLLFEFAWKTTWLIAYGLQEWLSGDRPPTFADDLPAILMGVILMPLVIPWPYVWRHYIGQPAERWS